MQVNSNVPTYFSRFGGLWTDRSDAQAEIERRLAEGRITSGEAESLQLWRNHGYVIIERAVDPAICDQLRDDMVNAWTEGDERLLIQTPTRENVPLKKGSPTERIRLVDIYAYYESARRALFSAKISRFLSMVFDDSPLLFQSLTFEKGSQQGIHQDTAYVVTSSPVELAASWIALEDVREGSGELMYYEGSHRLPEYAFSGKYKHWNQERDGAEQHQTWTQALVDNAQRMGMPRKTFLPRKGDALIWSADLAHGGSPVTDDSLTRRSLVGHYCPNRVNPHYFSYQPRRRTKTAVEGGVFSTSYYDTKGTPGWQPPTPKGRLLRRLLGARATSRA